MSLLEIKIEIPIGVPSIFAEVGRKSALPSPATTLGWQVPEK